MPFTVGAVTMTPIGLTVEVNQLAFFFVVKSQFVNHYSTGVAQCDEELRINQDEAFSMVLLPLRCTQGAHSI